MLIWVAYYRSKVSLFPVWRFVNIIVYPSCVAAKDKLKWNNSNFLRQSAHGIPCVKSLHCAWMRVFYSCTANVNSSKLSVKTRFSSTFPSSFYDLLFPFSDSHPPTLPDHRILAKPLILTPLWSFWMLSQDRFNFTNAPMPDETSDNVCTISLYWWDDTVYS